MEFQYLVIVRVTKNLSRIDSYGCGREKRATTRNDLVKITAGDGATRFLRGTPVRSAILIRSPTSSQGQASRAHRTYADYADDRAKIKAATGS